MCFSNLPIEFDEEGNPYLAEEAEDVERPGEQDRDRAVADGRGVGSEHGATCDCATTDTTTADLATDPEGAYEAIVAALPADARNLVDGGRPDGTPDTEPAESD